MLCALVLAHSEFPCPVLSVLSWAPSSAACCALLVPAQQRRCLHAPRRFFDLLRIFDLNGLPSETNPYLFNGQ